VVLLHKAGGLTWMQGGIVDAAHLDVTSGSQRGK
jgi:hypothetical protein